MISRKLYGGYKNLRSFKGLQETSQDFTNFHKFFTISNVSGISMLIPKIFHNLLERSF